ncbi:SDR family oxidoreductase [Catalinimonas alkaloidigena]|nr:SDR family oxidoreductase [Catalinimonas alkaloidigena]
MTQKNPTSTKKPEVVVITGASAGVGRATAREFGKRGAKVALLARGVDGLEGAKRDVEVMGGEALVIPTDVADATAVEAAAQQVEETFGPIDVWVNNAMNSVFAPFKEIIPADFKRVTEVTYLGQVYGTMAALKYMQTRDRGTIILVGSALAYRGIPLQSAYCGAKHGIQGFFDSLRAELSHDKSNINLTMVQLPAMNTTQFGWVKTRLPHKPRPMGTIYQPEVAARAITYAVDHPRREYFVGYPTFQAIWGDKIWPGFLDWYLGKTGIKGQQTDQPEAPDRKNNLWEPVPGDHGAHGDFDAEAWEYSPEMALSRNREWIAAGLGFALAMGAVLMGVKKGR